MTASTFSCRTPGPCFQDLFPSFIVRNSRAQAKFHFSDFKLVGFGVSAPASEAPSVLRVECKRGHEAMHRPCYSTRPLRFLIFNSHTMAKATKDSTRQDPVQLEAMVREFLNSNAPTERLRELARLLLTNGDILRVIRELTPEDQGRFVDKVDQVRRLVVSKSSLLTFFHPLRCTRPTRSSCSSLRNSAAPLTDYQLQPRFLQGSRRVEPFPSLPEG